MHISKEGNLITLINVFETTPEQQQALIDQWVRFTEEVRNEPGYVGTALHKSTDGTRVINDERRFFFSVFPLATRNRTNSHYCILQNSPNT
ncbi:MAG TPA: antibiotic biosynthesis monooxygenase family protein [Ktedonobacteraceae bacterium]